MFPGEAGLSVVLFMKSLGLAITIAILAGCSQEALDFAQTTEPQSQPTVEPETVPGNLSPQPKEIVAPIIIPEVINPPKPSPVEVTDPIEVTPTPTPPEIKPEETDPAIAELSPSEIVARKLISNDPIDNLEVLNDALEMWLATKGKLPEKIGDLVAEQLLPMLPMAPQGKIFEIDREAKRVVLVAED